MSLIQMERIENESKDPNDTIWSQSSSKRAASGLCILDVELLKTRKLTSTSQWIHYFSCSSHWDVENGEVVLVSTMDGEWGKTYATIISLSSKEIESDIEIVKNTPNLLVVSASSPLDKAQKYRLDKFHSFDLSSVLVNNVVSFATSLNIGSSQTNPMIPRFQDIIINGSEPRMSHRFSSLDQIVESIEDRKMLSLLGEDEWGDHCEHVFLSVQKLIKQCNEEQQQAILMCFNSEDLAILKGYPGTGKTTVISVIIMLCFLLKKSVYLTSHTHSAIDNVLIKLLPYSTVLIRVFNRFANFETWRYRKDSFSNGALSHY